MKIVKSDDSIGTTNKADTSTVWVGDDPNSYVSYGADNDLWDETWSSDDINNANFGVVFSADVIKSGAPIANTEAFVDHMRITVYYTEAPSNTAPTLSGEVPANTSTGVALEPTCNVTVNDADGDTMNVTFASNYSGSWVNYQTNSSVGNGTYRWDFTGASSYSTKYWWKVYANDGTDNSSEVYHFTTAAASRTWNKIHSMTANFSMGNTSIPRTWQTLSTFHCNFSFGNTSGYTKYWYELPTFTCNFSFGNVSIPRTWNTIPSMHSNFSFGNTSIPRTWQNLPTFTCNFSMGNTSIPRTWNTLSTFYCNFSLGNTSIPRTWNNIHTMTANFSFGNTSIPRTWNKLHPLTANFSMGNTSIPRTWQTLSTFHCNFSFGNTSGFTKYWYKLNTFTANFSFGNTSSATTITISNPYPSNSSTEIALQPNMRVTISHTNGKTMNITWYDDNGSVLLGTTSSIGNGTYSFNHFNATEYYDLYYWKVSVEAAGTTAQETYHFTTDDDIEIISSRDYSYAVAGVIGLLGFVMVMVRRRKKNG